MSSKQTRRRRPVCEWCKERPGDYDMSPPDREYATMIGDACFVENFRDIAG